MTSRLTLVVAFGLAALAFVGARPTGAATNHALANHRQSWMARDANPRHPWLYADSGSANVIAIYDLGKIGTPQIGQLAGLADPNGMIVDARGYLYEANYAGGTVDVFPPGATSPSYTISQGLVNPLEVTLDAAGNLYVTNRNPASIVVYPPGQTAPSETLSSTLMQAPVQLAFDFSGNLYVADNNNGVLEKPTGSQDFTSLNLEDLPHANGFTIDPRSGNLIVSNIIQSNNINVYAPGNKVPIRVLNEGVAACELGTGKLSDKDSLFVPDCGDSILRLYRHDGKKLVGSLSLPAPGNPAGPTHIALKPAGVP